jgi:hypothetical protein
VGSNSSTVALISQQRLPEADFVSYGAKLCPLRLEITVFRSPSNQLRALIGRLPPDRLLQRPAGDTPKAEYDKSTGRLREIVFDANKNRQNELHQLHGRD